MNNYGGEARSRRQNLLIVEGVSSFLCKFFRKNFMGRGTSPFVELAALKLHLIKAST